jgi:hypothetical protein
VTIPQGERCTQCGAIMKLSKRERDGNRQDEIWTCTRCHAEKVKKGR